MDYKKATEQSFNSVTNEEFEIRKKDISNEISNMLIIDFSHENILEIMNNIKDSLNRNLEVVIDEENYKLKSQSEYLDNLRKIIY